MVKDNYWFAYYDSQIVERSNNLRQEYSIESADAILHIDAYQRPDPNAPVVLINHGEGEYSRMFVGVALALYDRGYTVLVLDQRGHGFSSGRDNDFTLVQLTQDVLDGAHWARRHFSGPLFLAGVNQASEMVYQASAMGAPVVGLICHNLYDLPSPQGALALSRFSNLANLPGGAQMASAAARTLMAISPRMRVSIDSLRSFDGLLDERDNGRFEAWQEDPNLARTVSLRYAVSTFATPLALPYEANALPALVITTRRDRMTDPQITRRNYERLGGPKSCVELDYGHWSMLDPFAQEWAGAIDGWIKTVLKI